MATKEKPAFMTPTGRTPPPCTWLAYGSYFRLPVTVKWGSYNLDYCQVRLHETLPLLRVQRAALEQLLQERAIGRDGEGWSFHSDGLAQLAVPVKGEPDPETLVRWNPDELIYELPEGDDWSGLADNGAKQNAAVAQRVRKFLNAFVDRVGLAGFSDFGELEGFYYILCNFMMRYLQGGTEAVDLVFCRLFPTPCKPQWLTLLKRPGDLWRWHRRDKKLNLWMTRRSGQSMGAQDLGRRASKERKLGWRWRVGVLHNPRWEKSQRQQEVRLLEVLGEYGYAQTNYERSAKVWTHLSELLAEWIEARGEPALADALALFQNVTIRPRSGQVKRGRPRGRGANHHARKGIAPNEPGRKPGQRRKVAGADAGLPEMSNISQAAPDLRDAGGDDPAGTQR